MATAAAIQAQLDTYGKGALILHELQSDGTNTVFTVQSGAGPAGDVALFRRRRRVKVATTTAETAANQAAEIVAALKAA